MHALAFLDAERTTQNFAQMPCRTKGHPSPMFEVRWDTDVLGLPDFQSVDTPLTNRWD